MTLKASRYGAGILFALAAFPVNGLAADFDGSQNLICSTIDTVQCDSGGDCIQGRARDVNIPQFLRLDFTDMTVRRETGEETERSSKIDSLHKEDGRLILQGTDQGRGWTMLVSGYDGHMTVTAADDGHAFIVFGACTTD